MPLSLIRIIDVAQTKDGIRVAYYDEDKEKHCLWHGEPPEIGSVYAFDPLHQKDARKIAVPEAGSWSPDSDALRWRKPLQPCGLSRMEILRRRHIIKRAVRNYFDSQNFIEIDAPLLVSGTTPDISVDSFSVDGRYLATSTEYQLKRLAVGGFTRLYSLTQNFRAGDSSAHRNPEFTMLEWGRIGESMKEIENDVEEMTASALAALRLPETIDYQGRRIDMKRPWDRLPVLAAIESATGIRITDFDASSCRKAAEAAGMEIRADWAENRDFLFSLLMDFIQPQLGSERPVFLTDWPLFQTTSAGADPSDPSLASRSELYIGGLEIGDGFAGLADADMQTRLFEHAMVLRAREGKEPVALDKKYLETMRLGCPYGAGMALGFDRLVMLLTNQPTIVPTLAFSWNEL